MYMHHKYRKKTELIQTPRLFSGLEPTTGDSKVARRICLQVTQRRPGSHHGPWAGNQGDVMQCEDLFLSNWVMGSYSSPNPLGSPIKTLVSLSYSWCEN